MPKDLEPIADVEVVAYKDGRLAPGRLQVIRELPLTLLLGDKEIVTLLYNGADPEELAAGFFFSEGFFDRAEDVHRIAFDLQSNSCRVEPSAPMEFFEDLWGKRLITSGCGKGGIFYHVMDSIASGRLAISSTMEIAAQQIGALANEVFKPSELARATHGVHAAALCDPRGVVLFREDIGRHNALDKIAGRCLLDRVDRSDKLLFTTGRLSSEVIIKAGRLGCPIVASRSSATSLALELALKIGITVVGGARSGSFHIYTGAGRIRQS
jgi:FdhD protein